MQKRNPGASVNCLKCRFFAKARVIARQRFANRLAPRLFAAAKPDLILNDLVNGKRTAIPGGRERRKGIVTPAQFEIKTQYDFLLVGAGAAGLVLAAELSASGAEVLVIESGGPDEAPTISNPSTWFYNVAGPLDYNLPISPFPQLNNRSLNMALGHVLGGGSSINALVWGRGMHRDYDDWAKNGADGWDFPMFSRRMARRLRTPWRSHRPGAADKPRLRPPEEQHVR